MKSTEVAVKILILSRFLRKRIIGMRYVNRSDISFKGVQANIVQDAIDELLKNGFLERHHRVCVSINPRMLKQIYRFLSDFDQSQA